MKILHVLNELRPSGAETMLRLAAPIWASRGYESHILATGQEIGAYAPVLKEAGYTIHHLPRKKSPAYFYQFYRFIKDEGYAIVHQHAEGARYWFCASALAAGAKLATTVHSNFRFDGELRLRRKWQRKHLHRLGVAFIAIAPGVLENESTRFGIRPRLIWNWFDTERFHVIEDRERQHARAFFGYVENDKVVITLGNCSAVKNHGSVFRALQQLPDVKYLHVGEEEASRSERILAEELGIADRVQFAGWLADPRLALAAADVYAMPSMYEGLGIAALEAIGSGLPCLLANAPGLVDLAELDLDLTYVDPEPSRVASELSAMFISLDRLRRAAHSNSAKIIKQLAVEIGAGAYADYYEELTCSN